LNEAEPLTVASALYEKVETQNFAPLPFNFCPAPFMGDIGIQFSQKRTLESTAKDVLSAEAG
jgi:hypothetical protein